MTESGDVFFPLIDKCVQKEFVRCLNVVVSEKTTTTSWLETDQLSDVFTKTNSEDGQVIHFCCSQIWNRNRKY